jgi:hypothetical protein
MGPRGKYPLGEALCHWSHFFLSGSVNHSVNFFCFLYITPIATNAIEFVVKAGTTRRKHLISLILCSPIKCAGKKREDFAK